jgi:hypothetical protein
MDPSEATGLTRFGAMADQHWKEHRPRLYQRLKARSLLMPALLNTYSTSSIRSRALRSTARTARRRATKPRKAHSGPGAVQSRDR